jgi:hypothetical protein
MDLPWNTKISSGASARAKASVLKAMKLVGFCGPVSGYYPESGRVEEALSSLVALYHHAGQSRWASVPLRSLSGEPTGLTAKELISPDGVLVPEFPLIHSTQDEERIWGAMRIDLLYFNPRSKAAGFIDSKLGSPFHYEATPETIQPARYLERILQLAAPERFFLFATSNALFGEPGYLPLLQAVCDFSEERRAFSTCYVIAWEDVVGALAV